jgi:hypothetical protein
VDLQAVVLREMVLTETDVEEAPRMDDRDQMECPVTRNHADRKDHPLVLKLTGCPRKCALVIAP